MASKDNGFDQSLPMILNRALDSVMPMYRELFSRYGLTEQQWRILRVVWTYEKVNSVDLSNKTLLATASLVGIIDRLEKKDLVSRIRSTDDRRVVYIIATAKSRKLEKEVTPQVAAIQAQERAALSAKEWASMEMILAKISDAMLVNRNEQIKPASR